MNPAKPDMLLWVSDSRGIYIPQAFARSFLNRGKNVSGVSEEDWAILESGPDHEFYWDTWTDVCDSALITDEQGIRYTVFQEGDCWLVPVGMEWNDAAGAPSWPEQEEEEV